MKTKSNTQSIEKPMVANEPAVEYELTATSTTTINHLRPNNLITLHKPDQQSEEWLQPLTLEQINSCNEEAELADIADDLLTSEQVFKEMENKHHWLCK